MSTLSALSQHLHAFLDVATGRSFPQTECLLAGEERTWGTTRFSRPLLVTGIVLLRTAIPLSASSLRLQLTYISSVGSTSSVLCVPFDHQPPSPCPAAARPKLEAAALCVEAEGLELDLTLTRTTHAGLRGKNKTRTRKRVSEINYHVTTCT